jgi:hypothetical protein
MFVPNARTVLSDVIAVTSVADKLPSHHVSVAPVTGKEDDRRKMLVKPRTELSRMGYDRWMLNLESDRATQALGTPRAVTESSHRSVSYPEEETLYNGGQRAMQEIRRHASYMKPFLLGPIGQSSL